MTKVSATLRFMRNTLSSLLVIIFVAGAGSSLAQSDSGNSNGFKSLRSDVGIIGLTANFRWLNDSHYMGNRRLQPDSNDELEIIFRNVRTISPRAGVGFQVLTSFFAGDSDFGIGSWGIGPVVRGYALERDQWQPYFEADMLLGNNLALGDLADTRNSRDGFRVRLGLRAGVTYRINNKFGFFVEGGPDWESSRIFRSDARAWQLNFGLDLYRFN